MLLFMLLSSAWAAPIHWRVDGDVLTARDGALVLRASFEDAFEIGLVGEADFDGDGRADTVVIASTGGNCCPSEIYFASVRHGAIVTAQVGATWGLPAIVDRGGTWAVTFRAVGQGVGVWGFDSNKVIVLVPPARHILAATAEVTGPGTITTDTAPRTLLADLDENGEPESIACEVWSRWGSLLCALPLPGGGTQKMATGCERLGVLASVTHGRHDLVCGDDLVLRFDGRRWEEASDLPR